MEEKIGPMTPLDGANRAEAKGMNSVEEKAREDGLILITADLGSQIHRTLDNVQQTLDEWYAELTRLREENAGLREAIEKAEALELATALYRKTPGDAESYSSYHEGRSDGMNEIMAIIRARKTPEGGE